MSSVLRASQASDWRQPAPGNTVYLQLDAGQVVFELAPDFAPAHIANLRQLIADRYFDGLAVNRSQDNYVVQWGDPHAGSDGARSMGGAKETLTPEFTRSATGLDFTTIDSNDAYADEVGFSGGFPAARDRSGERAWLTHCYGTLGVGRGNAAQSGSGAELYVVTGHAPRHLDRNVTLIGRVISGMELLSTLPRGKGPLGFYESPAFKVRILSMRLGADLPISAQLPIELLRTDTQTFTDLVESRRYRAEEWFVDPTGRIDLCNIPLPARMLN
ncbi:MAG: peptidylprolyl isomerase [Woeseiaceae bacterium]